MGKTFRQAERQQRGELVAQMRAINDKALAEKREPTAEEDAEWNRLDAAQEKLGTKIARDERQAKLDQEMAEPVLAPMAPEVIQPDGKQDPVVALAGLGIKDLAASIEMASPSLREQLALRASPGYAKGFSRWLGTGGLPSQYRAALQSDSDVAGGTLVAPLLFVNDLIKAVDDQVFIRQLATKRTVLEAQSLGVPSLDADPADPDWTSEIATGSEDSSMSTGKREWHPHPLAKRIKVSNKLIRQTVGGADSLVLQRLAYKNAIAQEKGFMLGPGASQPLGLMTPSANGISTGRDVQTGSATNITADGLIDALYKLKAAYQASAAWIFHRDAIKLIRKLKDSQGQYIWAPAPVGQASLAAGQADTILGRPFYMSEYMPNTFTTGKYVGIVGDFSFYWIADALSLTIQRLVELYAETNQTGFISRLECDGMPVLEEAFARLITN